MQKKIKLTLDDLQVQSFVTVLSKEESFKLRGQGPTLETGGGTGTSSAQGCSPTYGCQSTTNCPTSSGCLHQPIHTNCSLCCQK